MARVLAKRWFLVEFARAKAIWPDVKSSFEFKIVLLLFVMLTVGLAVFGFIARR